MNKHDWITLRSTDGQLERVCTKCWVARKLGQTHPGPCPVSIRVD